ncbi:unnamed protein product [Pedinophyceae sp. YPF-701]|nr:unnamed protein product [Pedinophyceae sp. YPF-701]
MDVAQLQDWLDQGPKKELDLEGGFVHGNGRDTVDVTRPDLVIRNAYIRGVRMYVQEPGSGLTMENVVLRDYHNNSEGGLVGVVQVHGATNVRIRRCKMSNGVGRACCGLYATDGAKVYVEGSECCNNGASGVFASVPGTEVQLKDTKCNYNDRRGVTARQAAKVTIENGELCYNFGDAKESSALGKIQVAGNVHFEHNIWQ